MTETAPATTDSEHPPGTASVVFVHGLWMNGLEMRLLRSRMRRYGYHVHQFSYASVRRKPAAHAAALAHLVARMPGEKVHLVGHSLGGLIILHLLYHHFPRRFGRAVLLGSPVGGSRLARRVRRLRPGAWLVGRSWDRGLDGRAPDWDGGAERLGIIAGTWGVGLSGMVAGPLEPPHDGVVALEETFMPGASHLSLHVSHVSMLFSRRVAEATAAFLEKGHFPEATD